MRHLRWFVAPALATAAVAGLAALVLVALPATGSRAADHLDAPEVKKDGRTDINDVYVFHPPSGGGQSMDKTVLAMTVNPAAGVISGSMFDPKARYEFAVDTDGDAVEDIIYRVVINKEVAKAYKLSGDEDGDDDGDGDDREWDDRVPVALARTGDDSGGHGLGRYRGKAKLLAATRDDPFFFDLNAFNAGAAFCMGPGGTGSDFFLGLNVSAIVLEIPTTDIKSGPVGVWGRTLVKSKHGNWRQVDRMGRPAINTVFIPSNPFEPAEPSMEDAFNAGQPVDDQADFRSEVVDSLALLYSLNDGGGDDPSDDAAKISGLADVLLPDILTADLSMATGFLNGRNLADDVIDAELGLITEGLLTTDCVANDSAFMATFPYLALKN